MPTMFAKGVMQLLGEKKIHFTSANLIKQQVHSWVIACIFSFNLEKCNFFFLWHYHLYYLLT